MKYYSTLLFVTLSLVMGANGQLNKTAGPTHCIELTKVSNDFEGRFSHEYPVSYIQPGQREAYQELHCINPPAVSLARTLVCDWAAPPLLVYTYGDQYMHVIRQDPSGMYRGNAVIKTLQQCNHRFMLTDESSPIVLSQDNISG